jgi:hypothetical protein
MNEQNPAKFSMSKITKNKVRYEETHKDKPMTGGAIYLNQGFLTRQFGEFPKELWIEMKKED